MKFTDVKCFTQHYSGTRNHFENLIPVTFLVRRLWSSVLYLVTDEAPQATSWDSSESSLDLRIVLCVW